MAAAGVGFFTEGEVPYTAAEALEAVELFLELGADATAVDAYGYTALHGAAFRGVNEVVRLLLAEGAKLDLKNNLGWMPWRIAHGVGDQYGLRRQLATSAFLRQLMNERGLWTEEQAASLRGPPIRRCRPVWPSRARRRHRSSHPDPMRRTPQSPRGRSIGRHRLPRVPAPRSNSHPGSAR